MTSPWATLLSSGNKSFDLSLEDTALKENAVLTFKALNPDVSAEPDYLPLIAATGVLLLEANDITQLYFHHRLCSLKELG